MCRSTGVSKWVIHTNQKCIIISGVREWPGPQYHNPDPLIRMIGKTNIMDLINSNLECEGLIDPGFR